MIHATKKEFINFIKANKENLVIYRTLMFLETTEKFIVDPNQVDLNNKNSMGLPFAWGQKNYISKNEDSTKYFISNAIGIWVFKIENYMEKIKK